MTKLIDKLFEGVPEGSRPQFLRQWIKHKWLEHRELLDLIAQNDNPLRTEAARELVQLVATCKALVNEWELSTMMDPIAKNQLSMLSKLNISSAVTTMRWKLRTPKIDLK